MKNVSILVFIVIIAGLLVLSMVSFQVRVTESALVTRFGEVKRTITEPGFYWKLPGLIEKVRKFDSRAYLFKGVLEETPTRGGDPITATSYVVWKIGDPQKYLERVTDKVGAEKQLESMLRNTQNTIIGQHYFSDFVNSDPKQVKLAQIESEILQSLKTEASDNYGIDIQAVGLKQLGISKEVTAKVFDRMKKDREREKAEIISQGNAEGIRITTEAERKRNELLAIVESQAEAIRGAGDAEAAKYYKMLESNPKLAMYLRNIDALKKILKEKSTIVLGQEMDIMELLKGVPEIKSGE
ncbi:MAG: protease modulator HflC [Planctomycetes bacterium]|nr:protease modulator HflC [Planctomycetota bacterium]